MPSPLTVKRNDYRARPKRSDVYTPPGVARFLFDTLSPRFLCRFDPKYLTVFDPAIGSGRLTDPWYEAGCRVLGCDTTIKTKQHNGIIKGRFEDCAWRDDWPTPVLVLANPPFNGAEGRRLYPEVFLQHTFKLFGADQPVVLFAPMGFRLNQRRKSTRWRWLRDCGTKLTTIVSLPLDTFPGVEFHAEILIFNVSGIHPHYFLPETAL